MREGKLFQHVKGKCLNKTAAENCNGKKQGDNVHEWMYMCMHDIHCVYIYVCWYVMFW